MQWCYGIDTELETRVANRFFVTMVTRPSEDVGLQPNPYAPPAGNNQPSQSHPDSTTHDIQAIIDKVVAASNAKLSAEIKDTRDKLAQLEVEISNLHDIITTNAQQIAAATSQATISALTGPKSPFVT